LLPGFAGICTPSAFNAFSRFLTLAAFFTLSILPIQSTHAAEWRENNEFSFMVLGVGTSRLQETRFDLRKGEHRLTVGAQYAKYRAAQTLASPFSDAAHDYDAGELINARIKKTWYEMNYLNRLAPTRLFDRELTISVGGGIVVFDFDYQLGSSHDLSRQNRSDIGYRLGGEFDWRLGQRLSLSSVAYFPVPAAGTPSILSLDLTASYELWRLQNTRVSTLLGVAYHQVDHPERLPVPDQIELMTGPLLKLGLSLSF